MSQEHSNLNNLTFPDNSLLSALFGEQNKNLQEIESKLNVMVSSRGNAISIAGPEDNVKRAKQVMESLYDKLTRGIDLEDRDIDAEIKMAKDTESRDKNIAGNDKLFREEIIIKTPKKFIKPFSPHQKRYIKRLYESDMVFSCGPAGTGKTYLAVAVAVSLLTNHMVDRIILCRPAVEAGEKIGFLPGDMKDKVDPYMQPLYDALYDMIPADKVHKYIENRVIEIAPLAFMRGRTLSNAYVILDEAQNSTPSQMKMFLTRLGEGSKMVINGDLSQNDLPANIRSGLADAMERFNSIDEISKVFFDEDDIVRHSLVAKIVKAYSNG